jgi:hypothetical protein
VKVDERTDILANCHKLVYLEAAGEPILFSFKYAWFRALYSVVINTHLEYGVGICHHPGSDHARRVKQNILYQSQPSK